MKIDFMVPGFSKCGTTTLCALLTEHPDIYIPDLKEPRFFNEDNYESRWCWYAELYENAPAHALLGDGSTYYTVAETEVATRDRINKYYPQVKLILLARDPIARLESSYKQHHHSGSGVGLECPYSIGEAIREIPAMIPDSRYGSRLKNYLEKFPREQIHVVLMEDLVENAGDVLKGCFEFLDVGTNIKISDISRRLNPGSAKYYDSRILREMRDSIWQPKTGIPLGKIPLDVQDQFLPRLGLRKPFNNTVIEWKKEDEKYLLDQLGEDVENFLTLTGYSVDRWPRFKQLCESNTGLSMCDKHC